MKEVDEQEKEGDHVEGKKVNEEGGDDIDENEGKHAEGKKVNEERG